MSARRGRARGAAAAAAAIVASVALVAHGGVTTDASWNDREFAHGAVGALEREAGAFATRGEGRLLSGSLLGVDLDSIAALAGIAVTNDGTRSRPDTASASRAGDDRDAYADPLSVEALGAVDIALPGVLQLPLQTDLGLVGQYARASSDGTAVGAAGALTSSGAIALDRHAAYPELATLSLSTLLEQIDPTVAETLGDVTDVSLVAGAVTGRAHVDGCGRAWSGAASAVTREYLAASLRTHIQSPTVGALVRGVSGAIDSLELAVDGLVSDDGAIGSVTSGLTGLVDGVLDASSVGSVRVSGEIDLAAVRSLVSGSFGDERGVLTVDPAAGTISVDTAALLAAAYPGQYSAGLNGLPPNTDLLGDAAIISTLTAALGTAAAQWIADVEAALVTAIDAVRVSAGARISALSLLGLPIASVDVTVQGTLGDLLDGRVSAQVTPLLGDIGGALVGALVAGFGELVGTAVDGALSELRTLPTAVKALADPIVIAVSTAYSTLFADRIVAVTVNAQNDPTDASAEPHDWSSLPEGRFDVAALRISVLDAPRADGARLYLGRASVGPGCVLARAPLPCAGY